MYLACPLRASLKVAVVNTVDIAWLKDPAEYNVYEILYAVEDSIALVSCLEDDVEPCPMFNDCLTAPLWQYLQDEFRHVMERVSLQDVMDHKFPVE